MKKKCASLLLVSSLLAALISTSYANEYTITTPYEYPITPFMDEWKDFESHPEMIAACQIPEDILSKLDTAALAETVVNYPLLSDMLIWSDKTLGFQNVASYFNGLSELLSREGGIDYLLTTTPMLCSQAELSDDDNFVERNKIRCITLIHNNVSGEPVAVATSSTPVLERGDIKTPNGSLIPYYKDLDFVGLNILYGSSVPFTQNEFDDIEREYSLNYPNATKIGPISPRYNCHSYAWYSTSSNNRYWVMDIIDYLTDDSYENIANADASSGDVLIYWVNRNSLNHSARIESYRNNHSYVTSKWDFMGVYSHRDDYCPYYIGSRDFFTCSYTRS